MEEATCYYYHEKDLVLNEYHDDIHLCGYIFALTINAKGTYKDYAISKEYNDFVLKEVDFEVESVYPDEYSDDPQPLDTDEVLKNEFVYRKLEDWCEERAINSFNWESE